MTQNSTKEEFILKVKDLITCSTSTITILAPNEEELEKIMKKQYPNLVIERVENGRSSKV